MSKYSLKKIFNNLIRINETSNIYQSKLQPQRRSLKTVKTRTSEALDYLQKTEEPYVFVKNEKIKLPIDITNNLINAFSSLLKVYNEISDTDSFDYKKEKFEAWKKNSDYSGICRQIRNMCTMPTNSSDSITLDNQDATVFDGTQYEVDVVNNIVDVTNNIHEFKTRVVESFRHFLRKDENEWLNIEKNSLEDAITHYQNDYLNDINKVQEFYIYFISENKDIFQDIKLDVNLDLNLANSDLTIYKEKLIKFFELATRLYCYDIFYSSYDFEKQSYITRKDVKDVSSNRSDIEISYKPEIVDAETGDVSGSVSINNKVKIEVKSSEFGGFRGGSGTFYVVFPKKEHDTFIKEQFDKETSSEGPDCLFEIRSIAGVKNINTGVESGNILVLNKILNSSSVKISLKEVLAHPQNFVLDEEKNASNNSFVYYYSGPKYSGGPSELNFDISGSEVSSVLNKTWLEFYYGDIKKDHMISIQDKGLYLLKENFNIDNNFNNLISYLKDRKGLKTLSEYTKNVRSGLVKIRMQVYAKSRTGFKFEAEVDLNAIRPCEIHIDKENSYKDLYEIFTASQYFLEKELEIQEVETVSNIIDMTYESLKTNAVLSKIIKKIEQEDVYESINFDKRKIIKNHYKKTFLNSFSYLYNNKKINEGIFHMMHPYEYHSSNEFKLGGLLEIINEIENSTLKASEKLDGQNLWFSFRDGNPVFAYNMKELQAGGVSWNRLSEPYEIKDKKDIPKDFSSLEKIIRPHVSKEGKLTPSHGGHASFKDGVEVLHHCLVDAYSRNSDLINFIFENGENFSSSEVIHAEGPNQILYGENFIAPHFVMDKSGNQFPDKYTELFSLLKFEQNKVKNPKGFKLLTRAQRDTVALQIMEFEDEKEKLLFVNDLRDEYQKRIQSLINNTSLTLESTVKDFHRYHLVDYINSKGEQDLALNESFVDSLLLFIHGSTLKASGLSNTPDYKNILKRLNLGNAKERGAFKSSYIGDIVEIFFDFGIDINRGIKTTATSNESQDINHERIVSTNLSNIKKAFAIAKEIELEADRLTQLDEEENPEHKKLFSLARKLKFQISKIKSVIKRVKQRKGFASNKDALTFIISSSIEGLVLNRKIPDSDSVMELKLTGFFAPLNQVLNAIRFEVGHIDLLDQFLESDGQIFSLNNQNIPTTYDIESLLERKISNKKILNKANFSLREMYNLKTYSETGSDEFDIGVVPMSAKPFTIGHEDLVKTACQRSKEVYVVISTTSRMRSYENPITGDSMERLYFEDNPSGFVPDLESLLNRNVPECQGKVKVVYSKNPVTDVTTIFEEDFAYENLEKDKKYCIFVGDIEDAEVYSPDMLSHMEDSLNVVYRDSNEERLSSGTRTRASLNTGRSTVEREIPIKSKPGQTKIDKVVMLSDPYQEGSEMYTHSFKEFSRNLSNIYSMTQKKRIYDYISGESRNIIDDVLTKLRDVSSNKEAKDVLSKEEIKAMTSLGGFRKAKQMSLDMFN